PITISTRAITPRIAIRTTNGKILRRTRTDGTLPCPMIALPVPRKPPRAPGKSGPCAPSPPAPSPNAGRGGKCSVSRQAPPRPALGEGAGGEGTYGPAREMPAGRGTIRRERIPCAATPPAAQHTRATQKGRATDESTRDANPDIADPLRRGRRPEAQHPARR